MSHVPEAAIEAALDDYEARHPLSFNDKMKLIGIGTEEHAEKRRNLWRSAIIPILEAAAPHMQETR